MTALVWLGFTQKQLVEQKIHIEENEDRDTGLEQRHYKEDSDCVLAKVPLGDLDLYDGTYISLESKDIRSAGAQQTTPSSTLCFKYVVVISIRLNWPKVCVLLHQLIGYQLIINVFICKLSSVLKNMWTPGQLSHQIWRGRTVLRYLSCPTASMLSSISG